MKVMLVMFLLYNGTNFYYFLSRARLSGINLVPPAPREHHQHHLHHLAGGLRWPLGEGWGGVKSSEHVARSKPLRPPLQVFHR
jgi:hypothetical protein